MGRYCNDYYDKFPEAIKLKCGYDLDYIISKHEFMYSNFRFVGIHIWNYILG